MGGGWWRRAGGAYRQVDFNGKCIRTLSNWRLVAGGGYGQVELRAGSTVYKTYHIIYHTCIIYLLTLFQMMKNLLFLANDQDLENY